MAANHRAAQHPRAPQPNRAPQAGQPDLELLPLITDAFIDRGAKPTETRRWTELAMPAAVASAVRKTCSTEDRRDLLKFLREVKRSALAAAAAQPAAPNQTPPEPQAAAPQYGRNLAISDNSGMISDNSIQNNAPAPPPPFVNRQSERDPGSPSRRRDDRNADVRNFTLCDIGMISDVSQTNIQNNASAPPPPFVNRQSERDREALFGERFDAYRSLHPLHGPLGGMPRPRGSPPPGPRPRNVPAANESSSSVNAEDVIHSRAYDAYHDPPPGISRSHTGLAARDMHDAGYLHGPDSRGYF